MNKFDYKRPKRPDPEEYEKMFNDGIAYFGLPNEVEFCSECVISNQRPVSAKEYKHTKGAKKEAIKFEDRLCDACRQKKLKKMRLIGVSERLS